MAVLQLPERLYRRMTHVLRTSELRPEQVESVRAAISRGVVPDYVTAAAAFAYLYFGANFAKTYRAVADVIANRDFQRPIRILDLGSGHGASLAGAVAALTDHHLRVEQVVAIDHCSEQLSLLRQGVQNWLEDDYPGTRIDVRQSDVREVARLSEGVDLIVASYLLCEMSDGVAFEATLRSHPRFLRAEIVAIDSDEEGHPVWRSNARRGTFDRRQLQIDLTRIADRNLGEPKYNRRAA
jgi:SAM-dependent methyltransferase